MITGSAVVTTRLSSDTMNTATDVTMNVQIVMALLLIPLISFAFFVGYRAQTGCQICL